MVIFNIQRKINLLLMGSLMIVLLFVPSLFTRAQEDTENPVQVLTGTVSPMGSTVYDLLGMTNGDTLYLYLEPTAEDGSLLSLDVVLLDIEFTTEYAYVAESDPITLEYTIPQDGDYSIILEDVVGEEANIDFRMMVGINEPTVLEGIAEDNGAALLILYEGDIESDDNTVADGGATSDLIATDVELADGIQVLENTLGDGEGIIYALPHLSVGDTLYVYGANARGNLDPLLILWNDSTEDDLVLDYDSGGGVNAAFEYTITEDDLYYVVIQAMEDTAGDYRLTIGLNRPEVLTGAGRDTGVIFAYYDDAFVEADFRLVEVFEQSISAGIEHVYDLSNMFIDDTLYVRVENVTGNFDPFVTLFLEGQDSPIIVNDDGAGGLDAAFEYLLAATGDYTLHIQDCCEDGFGSYRLYIGLNSPLPADSSLIEEQGAPFAQLNSDDSNVGEAVDMITGALQNATLGHTYDLNFLNAGDTVYVYATSEDFLPDVAFVDFSGKERIAAQAGDDGVVTFEYNIPASGEDYKLVVNSTDETSTGQFDLIVGRNTDSVLSGNVSGEYGQAILREPTIIQIGIDVEQITDINQLSENYQIVGILRAQWEDRSQAFDAADCRCSEKIFNDRALLSLFSNNLIDWPEFEFINEQLSRIIQNRMLVIRSDGLMSYQEQFDVVLQAPEFDFRAFPFDEQHFWLRIETDYPDSVYQFVLHENPAFNRFGNNLGEEEWTIFDEDRSVSTYPDTEKSVYSLDFWLKRHLNFYIYRILIPLALIMLIGWAIFFIKNYDSRISASSGNLLIFIAFNFTIAGDLPRLGYLTFLDVVLFICFLITVFVFGINIYLRRLYVDEHTTMINRIDHAMIVLYPLTFFISVGITGLLYL